MNPSSDRHPEGRSALDATLPETLPELVAELTDTQRQINRLHARQARLIAAITHTQTLEAGDGSLVHLPMAAVGARLDAAALVATALGVGQQAAQARVSRSERLTGPLSPVLEAQASGALDERRSQLICEELEVASDAAAQEVALRVTPTLVASLATDATGESGVRLRRRIRSVIAEVDADGLRERVERARADRSLRRWAAESGIDEWLASLPVEQSAQAWAAVDALARDFVSEGRNDTLEQARADALVALVTGRSTITYAVQLAVALPPFAAPARALEVADSRREALHASSTPTPDVGPCARSIEATIGVLTGCSDHVTVSGLGHSQPSDVPARFVAEALRSALASQRVTATVWHPETGALIDPDGELDSPAYRPGARLAALIRARDGCCRFPGCSINARFCDLDHVRPWPAGPTSARNLMALCRRHHRIKQLPGWQVCLRPDGTVLWVDPIGRRSVTHALDHRPVAPARPQPESTGPGEHPKPFGACVPVIDPSPLEHKLEHALLGCRATTFARRLRLFDHPRHARCDTWVPSQVVRVHLESGRAEDPPPF